MLYRAVCLILVPNFLLCQGLSFGHVHGHGPLQSPGHDERPHVHVGVPWTSAAHHHGAGEDDGDEDLDPGPADHHDEDAVYLPTTVLLGCPYAQPRHGLEPTWAPAPEGAGAPATVFTAQPRRRPPLSHPPPSLPLACPIYLRTLTLLV